MPCFIALTQYHDPQLFVGVDSDGLEYFTTDTAKAVAAKRRAYVN